QGGERVSVLQLRQNLRRAPEIPLAFGLERRRPFLLVMPERAGRRLLPGMRRMRISCGSLHVRRMHHDARHAHSQHCKAGQHPDGTRETKERRRTKAHTAKVRIDTTNSVAL